MNDVGQNPKQRKNVQNLIAWPFIVVMVALMIMAPVWTIMRSPYGDYAMPMVTILLVVMSAIILLYNKICLGVWLPGRKKENSAE
jgi:hypothetical protein